jgi:SAM-dependent methyltransferase
MESATYDASPFVAEFSRYVARYASRKDIGFYVETARENGGPVLELGCGSGRILVPTARAGIEICGLDASASMLAACQEAIDIERPDVQRRTSLVRGDIRDFHLGRRFRQVTMPFRPFQYLLTVQDQLDCLGAVRRHLDPSGVLVLDLFVPSFDFLTRPQNPDEIDEEPPFHHPDGRKIVRRSRTIERDLASQTFAGELIYDVTHPDGRTESLVHRYRFRYLFRFEVEHLLARAGFALERVYADFDRSPCGSQYPAELICMARPEA